MTDDLHYWHRTHAIAVNSLQTLIAEHADWRSNHYGQRAAKIAEAERCVAEVEAAIADIQADIQANKQANIQTDKQRELWDAS